MHTHARDLQLGAVIRKEDKLIYLFSRKLTVTQKYIYSNRIGTSNHHQNFEII